MAWEEPALGEDLVLRLPVVFSFFVEQTFGQLMPRWGVVWRPLRVSLTVATRVVGVCAKLNTFCHMTVALMCLRCSWTTLRVDCAKSTERTSACGTSGRAIGTATRSRVYRVWR